MKYTITSVKMVTTAVIYQMLNPKYHDRFRSKRNFPQVIEWSIVTTLLAVFTLELWVEWSINLVW